MHCHKVMSEALHRLRFQAFLETLSAKESSDVTTVVCDMFEDFPNNPFQEKVKAESFSEIITKYESFVVQGSECNPLRNDWDASSFCKASYYFLYYFFKGSLATRLVRLFIHGYLLN